VLLPVSRGVGRIVSCHLVCWTQLEDLDGCGIDRSGTDEEAESDGSVGWSDERIASE
jgi:hypothetical protein